MPKLTLRPPKYRKHKASGQAVVTLNGRDFYLGPHGSTASRVEYDRLTAEWLQNGRSLPPAERSDTTVVEVIAAYVKFAKAYYVKNGRPTREATLIRDTMRFVRDRYGRIPTVDFGPLALKAVRQRMIEADHSRGYINKNIDRIRRMFRWASSEELVPASVPQALATVAGLRKGRTEARETVPVGPVEDSMIDTALPHLSSIVADMVRFQRLTGCRPAEVCIMRPLDVDTSSEVWSYRPESHKTEHHGRERVIFIGPKAQDVLRSYLLRDKANCCFVPAESEQKRSAKRRENRRSPMTPSQSKRLPKKNGRRRPGTHYDVASYRRAIHRACDRAQIERWSPNRLRHTAATEIRQRFGLEAAQVTLGHSRADVTQIYAERDMAKAAAVMAELG